MHPDIEYEHIYVRCTGKFFFSIMIDSLLANVHSFLAVAIPSDYLFPKFLRNT